jgi:thiol:disulfide interchange protein DsbD
MRKIFALLLSFTFVFALFEIDEGAASKIPAAKEAYKPKVAIEGDKVVVDIEMADGVYLYKKDLHLRQIEPVKKELPLSLPAAQNLHGDEVYRGHLRATAPASALEGERPKVELEFQGCNEAGICYPPQRYTFELTKGGVSQIQKAAKPEGLTLTPAKPLDLSAKSLEPPKSTPQSEPQKPQENDQAQRSDTAAAKDVAPKSDEDAIVSLLRDKGIVVILGSFFLFGLLLALTPCVFPMIPILSSLIVKSGARSAKKGFFYSLVYVLAMALTYSVVGVLAGLFGANLQAAFQNPFVIALFAAIFVALAFSMFGFYEIGLPASLQTKLAQKSDAAGSRGGVLGVAVMGVLSALIVGPCVAPPLAGALIYIGQTGDALLGGAALFVMSLGMGVPLLLVGMGAGRLMPKPGGWMTAVNKVFGVVMLGVAVWMLGRILPPSLTMALWAGLALGSAVYLRALEPLPQDAQWRAYLKKSAGIILFIYGLFLFYGAMSGATSPLRPIHSAPAAQGVQTESELFRPIKRLDELQRIIKSADKPVLVDVTAKWCASCKELEEFTFSDPAVRQELAQNFIAFKLDITDNTEAHKEFLRHFGLFGPPAILIFKDGREVRRIIGFKDAKSFLEILKEVE